MRRGVSLGELLLACALLGLLASALLLLHRAGLGARRRHEAHDRSQRAAMLAISYLRNELQVIQLLQPSSFSSDPVRECRYRRPRLEGPIRFDASGSPLWEQVCRLVSEDDGSLWRRLEEPGGQDRRLVQLGPGGGVFFSRPNEQLLRLHVYADFGEARSALRLEHQMLLPNQP